MLVFADLLQNQFTNAKSTAEETNTIIFLCVIKMVLEFTNILLPAIDGKKNRAGLLIMCKAIVECVCSL